MERDTKPIPDYASPETWRLDREGGEYRRWSYLAIFSLAFSVLTSPLVAWRILDSGIWRGVFDQVSFAVELGLPVVSFIFAIAVIVMITRSNHLKGEGFAMVAVVISLLGFCCLGSLFFTGGPN